MRFFSNESKESQDDAVPAEDQHPERVQSDPVSVPPQRAGSPWSSGPDAEPPFHEPAPQPTAFGASTPGGAVAASAAANPVPPRDGDDDRPLPTAGAHPVGPDDVAGPRSGDVVDVALDDRGSFEDPQVKGEPRTAEDTTPPDTSVDSAGSGDSPALKDEGGFDDPKVVDPASGDTVDSGDSPALKDEGGFDDPKVVDPASADSVSDDTVSDDSVSGDSASGSAVTGAAPTVAALFGSDAQAFRDRWRDVQLRFVDSPKEATAEAASMVDEAVDRLAAALKDQKSTLTGGGDDTEKLRVELRGYRDLLNRILDL